MALEIKQNLRLSQQLVITPQLQLAIKLLQLSRLELDEVIQQELAENPVLEADFSEEEEPREKPETVKEDWYERLPQEENLGFSLREYFRERAPLPRNAFSEDEERFSRRTNITKPETLADHLLWQLHMANLSEEERYVGSLIIGNLDEDGYLQVTLAEIAEGAKVDEARVEQVLKKVQDFEPAGVAARDLKECLILQLNVLGINSPLMERIINSHLGELEKKDYKGIALALSIPLKDVMAAAKVISGLEPKPGRAFGPGETEAHYIIPDIFIFKMDDDYQILLNDGGLPKLKINPLYIKGVERGEDLGTARQYLKERLRAATWLIKSIYQRQGTIKKVVESIVKFQRDFFDKGVGYLKPMVLRDVAQDISMHESTVSRVTTNKYAQTPQGVFELKYFFSSGLDQVGGGSMASESVKELIRELILREDALKPYSDQELVGLLKEKGVRVARRTVTKYRESMGKLSSNRRKKLF